jgi:hypothetical protein
MGVLTLRVAAETRHVSVGCHTVQVTLLISDVDVSDFMLHIGGLSVLSFPHTQSHLPCHRTVTTLYILVVSDCRHLMWRIVGLLEMFVVSEGT